MGWFPACGWSEVIETRSPMAAQLPDQAFLLRRGARVIEAGRFHLDLRHPAARAHLDATVNRLVTDFGVGMFNGLQHQPGTRNRSRRAERR